MKFAWFAIVPAGMAAGTGIAVRVVQVIVGCVGVSKVLPGGSDAA